MSMSARVILGVACFLIAVGFADLAIFYGDYFPKGPWPFYGLAAFSALIALACLVSASRPVALRVIGAFVCTAFAEYLYASRGEPNFWRALSAFCVFGMPAGYMALKGKYPWWGKAAGAFKASPSPQEDLEMQPPFADDSEATTFEDRLRD
jgi:hypothetical protein